MLACSIIKCGKEQERKIIIKEVHQRFRYIFENFFLSINLNENSFDKEELSYYFPPRYIREHSNAQIINVVKEIEEIFCSDIIRWELKPLYTYVIYQIINDWCKLMEDIYDEKERIKHLMPKSIKNMLKTTKMTEEDKELIVDWFTKDYLLDDYCNFYDEDLIDLHMMDSLAYLYLYRIRDYEMLGANIENALDLISKDLADLIVESKKIRCKNNNTEFDYFISYANEDKEYAYRLYEALYAKNVSVWIDDKQLKLGDQIRTSLEKGLINSKYGIILISKNYLNKYWTNQELNVFYELEEHGIKKIMPITIDISHEEIKQKCPFLANKYSIPFKMENIEELVQKILSDSEYGI